VVVRYEDTKLFALWIKELRSSHESVCIVTMWEDGESVDREEDTFNKAKVVVVESSRSAFN
jgi:hypothetical protein